MNELQTFNNVEFGEVRTVVIGNEPFFVGKDVVDILGYKYGSRDINKHVDEEDRHKTMIFDGKQNRKTIVINESGLYSLIRFSKSPKAKKFKRWVTAEILPAVRKHRTYTTTEIVEKAMNDPDFIIRLVTKLKEERNAKEQALKKIEEERNAKEQALKKIEEDKSKVTGKGQSQFINAFLYLSTFFYLVGFQFGKGEKNEIK